MEEIENDVFFLFWIPIKKNKVHSLLFYTRVGYGNLGSCMVRLWLNDNIHHVMYNI
jgi:hypothetical protein